MTLRLVGLMSIVLLLSLAAFGLLVGHYQKEFMQELPRTVSAVGQATVRTLDWRSSNDERALVPFGGNMTLHEEVDARVRRTVADRAAGEDQDPAPKIDRFRHVITTSTEDNQFTVQEHRIYPADAFPSLSPGEEGRLEACLLGHPDPQLGNKARFFIDVEHVRAESDPTLGVVLTIPKLTPTQDGEIQKDPLLQGLDQTQEQQGAGEGARGSNVFFARRDELQFPVPLSQYQDLFDKIRYRSLLLFLGVFVVGVALSAGLATRFTRPIRRLDAGIRKLSEGDLEVAVAVQDKGEIGRLSRAFNDMAGKLRANRERAREMVRREKLSALGRLAAGVAHDVRNPLHSIGLTLQHLSETSRPPEPERQAEFDRSLGVIRSEIGRLDQLVGNFLRFAKSERHEREPVDLGQLLRETVHLVQKESERLGIEVVLDLDERTPPVLADGEALRSAILNLVLNSFEAMPDGGKLSIVSRLEPPMLVLEVADTGRGIPEEHQEHVFDFAYTTREGGSGLGLAMVHHCVVEEHGGRVALKSRPGEGTRVRMDLPVNGKESA